MQGMKQKITQRGCQGSLFPALSINFDRGRCGRRGATMLLSLNSVLSPRDVASAHRGRGWILLSVESPLSVSAFPPAKCSALLQYMREGVPLCPPFKDPLKSQWPLLLVPRGERESGDERGKWRDVCFPSFGLGGLLRTRRALVRHARAEYSVDNDLGQGSPRRQPSIGLGIRGSAMRLNGPAQA